MNYLDTERRTTEEAFSTATMLTKYKVEMWASREHFFKQMVREILWGMVLVIALKEASFMWRAAFTPLPINATEIKVGWEYWTLNGKEYTAAVVQSSPLGGDTHKFTGLDESGKELWSVYASNHEKIR